MRSAGGRVDALNVPASGPDHVFAISSPTNLHSSDNAYALNFLLGLALSPLDHDFALQWC